MDARERRASTARWLGNCALAAGFLIAVIGLVTDSTPDKGYYVAGLLVLAGAGLRIEAAVTDRS